MMKLHALLQAPKLPVATSPGAMARHVVQALALLLLGLALAAQTASAWFGSDKKASLPQKTSSSASESAASAASAAAHPVRPRPPPICRLAPRRHNRALRPWHRQSPRCTVASEI